MLNEQELIISLQEKLTRATETRTRARKRFQFGQCDESHVSYAEGRFDGIESAIVAIVSMLTSATLSEPTGGGNVTSE
jgi:outer membrane protein TolC